MRPPGIRATTMSVGLAFSIFAMSATARAQNASALTATDNAAVTTAGSGDDRTAPDSARDAGDPIVPGLQFPRPARRPVVLVPLYVSFGTLQALDFASTMRALDRGGVEANPLMRTAVGSPAAIVALKAGITGLAVYSSEKLWKEHRAGAILMMIAFNGAYAAVVSHNYKVGR